MLERKILFRIYFICNTIAALSFMYSGFVGGDLLGYKMDYPIMMLCSLFIALFSIYFLPCVMYPFFEKIIKVKKIGTMKNYSILDWFVLIMNCSYGLFALKYDVGIAGVETNSSVPKIPLYFFILVQPLYFTYIYMAYTSDRKRLFLYINSSVLVFFSILQGWLGSLVFVAFIFIIIYKNYIIRNKFKIFSLFVVAILLSPFLKFFKKVVSAVNISNSGLTYFDAIDSVMDVKNIHSISDLFNTYLLATVERFSHVGVIYYGLVDKSISFFMSSNNITPPFAEGWIQNRIYSAFASHDTIDLQLVLARSLESAFSWRLQTPISLWMIVDSNIALLVLLYAFILMAIIVFLSKLLSNRVVLFSWFPVLTLLLHGWFYSVTLYIQALLVFIFFVSIFRVIKNKQ